MSVEAGGLLGRQWGDTCNIKYPYGESDSSEESVFFDVSDFPQKMSNLHSPFIYFNTTQICFLWTETKMRIKLKKPRRGMQRSPTKFTGFSMKILEGSQSGMMQDSNKWATLFRNPFAQCYR